MLYWKHKTDQLMSLSERSKSKPEWNGNKFLTMGAMLVRDREWLCRVILSEPVKPPSHSTPSVILQSHWHVMFPVRHTKESEPSGLHPCKKCRSPSSSHTGKSTINTEKENKEERKPPCLSLESTGAGRQPRRFSRSQVRGSACLSLSSLFSSRKMLGKLLYLPGPRIPSLKNGKRISVRRGAYSLIHLFPLK